MGSAAPDQLIVEGMVMRWNRKSALPVVDILLYKFELLEDARLISISGIELKWKDGVAYRVDYVWDFLGIGSLVSLLSKIQYREFLLG